MSVSLEVTTTIIVIDIALATTTHRIMHALFVFVEIIEIGVINLFIYRIIQGNRKNYLFTLVDQAVRLHNSKTYHIIIIQTLLTRHSYHNIFQLL